MKKEEYLTELKRLDVLRQAISKQIEALNENYIKANQEFNTGDKVKITNIGRPKLNRDAFIGDAYIDWQRNVTYTLKKAKKDGTISAINDFLHNSDVMERIVS